MFKKNSLSLFDKVKIIYRLLQRVEDLEENQKINDKMISILWKKIQNNEKNKRK